MNPEAIRQHNQHKAVSARLWGKPKIKNIAKEQARAIEECRQAERRKWELEQARAKEKAEAEKAARERIAMLKPSEISTAGSIIVPLSYQEQVSVRVDINHAILLLKRDLKAIAKDVLQQHPPLTLEDIRGDCRKSNVMLARRHVIAAIRMYRPDLSYPAIGRFVRKDHSTCVHAVRQFVRHQIGRVSV